MFDKSKQYIFSKELFYADTESTEQVEWAEVFDGQPVTDYVVRKGIPVGVVRNAVYVVRNWCYEKDEYIAKVNRRKVSDFVADRLRICTT